MEISTILLRWETRVAPLLRETRESQRRWVEERHVGVSGALPNIFGLDHKKKKVERSLPGEVESFRRLCAVLDYVQNLKHGRARDTGRLHALIEAHLDQSKLVMAMRTGRPSGIRLCIWRDNTRGIAFCSTPYKTKGTIRPRNPLVTLLKSSTTSRSMCWPDQ